MRNFKPFAFGLEPDYIDRIRLLAKEQDITVGHVLRRIVKFYFENKGQAHAPKTEKGVALVVGDGTHEQ